MSNVRTHAMQRSLARIAATAGMVVALASGNHARAQQDVSVCDEQYATSANSAYELLAFLDRCGDIDFPFAVAVLRLNQLPPPATQPLSLQPRHSNLAVDQVTLQADVFFHFMMAYPRELAVEKLNDLLRAAGKGFAIQVATVLASADPTEAEFPLIPVAKQRSAMLRQLLVNAGFPADRVFASERGARHPDTPEGRARDRSAEITIVLLRERSP